MVNQLIGEAIPLHMLQEMKPSSTSWVLSGFSHIEYCLEYKSSYS